MEYDLVAFLIVCPLTFLGGFVDAIAGGGGLISLPAYLIAGLPAHFAIGTNKLSSAMGTALTTWRFARSGYIHWTQAGLCAVCALVASSIGARLALMLDEKVFSYILLVILPLTAVYVFRCKTLSENRPPIGKKLMYILSMLVACVTGVYDGFYGPGAGTFMLLLLTGVAHMKLTEANGISKVINLMTNIAALSVMLLYGKVLIPLGFAGGIFGMAGNYIGTKWFDRGGGKIVKPIIILVLAVFMGKIIMQM